MWFSVKEFNQSVSGGQELEWQITVVFHIFKKGPWRVWSRYFCITFLRLTGNVHPNCWFRRRKVDHELSVEHWTRSLSSCELLVGSLEFSSSLHVLWRRPWPCFPGNPVRGNEALSHTGASFLSSCSWWDRISRYSWGERSVLWGISELRFCFLQMT